MDFTTETLHKAKTYIQNFHDELSMGMRWGSVRENGRIQKQQGGCFASSGGVLDSALSHNWPGTFLVFHGDGTDIPLAGLANHKLYNKLMSENPRPWNKFEGTPRSKRWVSFLLSENSPWKALHPFLAETDEDYINNGGFIFKARSIPRKLWYNFAMAIRFPWEQSLAFSTFLYLLDEGLEQNLACFIANSFFLSEGATSLQGPWTIQYPMSYLETMTLEAAGRFILSKPGTLDPREYDQPNCKPLWSCKPDNIPGYEAQAEVLSTRTDLMLPEIIAVVNAAVAAQSQEF